MIERLLLLGAGGDLVARLLLPALAALVEHDRVPDLEIVSVGRDDLNDTQLRERSSSDLEEFAADLPKEVRDRLVGKMTYVRADVTDPAQLAAAVPSDRPCAVYLALPNTLFEQTCAALAEVGLPDGSVLAVEKPFGADLEGARALNKAVVKVVPESHVFRADHFMAMRGVLDIVALRFSNSVWEPLWNADNVERVDVVFDEQLALEGRAGYYDEAGALRDMLQSHLLQVLAVVAMERPDSLDEADLRQRKAEVLAAVHVNEPYVDHTRRARYTSGTVDGQDVPSYVDEDGVDADRRTETFAELRLRIDGDRWAGVPFLLRSGKALGSDRYEVVITFRPVVGSPFEATPPQNRLRLSIDPGGVVLEQTATGGDEAFPLVPLPLSSRSQEPVLPPYALLLSAVLQADVTLSLGAEEAETCWRIVEPVLAAWADDEVPMLEYVAGSDGPPD